MWAALATMVVGILGAVAQTDIRRILSFTLVSHIGYMVFGIALATAAGLAGAIFYVVHHIAIQTTLFLVAGPDRAAGRLDGGGPARRAGEGVPAAGGAVLRARDEPGRHPAVVGVHRQARAAGGRRRRRRLAALRRWSPAASSPACSPSSPSPASGAGPSGGRRRSRPAEDTFRGRGRRRRTRVGPRARPGTSTTRSRPTTPRPRTAGRRRRPAPPRARPPGPGTPPSPPPTTPGHRRPGRGRREPRAALRPLPRVMVGATAAMVAVTVALTVLAGPLYGVADQAADDLLRPGARTSPRSSAGRAVSARPR